MGGTEMSGCRRTIAVVLTVVVAVAVATGVALRSPASRSARVTRAPLLVHNARAFAEPGASVELEVAAYCSRPQDPEVCRIRSGTIHVTPADGAAVDLPGEVRGDRVRFEVPASLARGGFRYRIDVENVLGQVSGYPPGDPDAGLQVHSTAGLAELRLPAFSWHDTLPGEPVVELPFGDGPGQVGLLPSQGEGLASGESSFDVGPDGSIYVADRVNRRIQILDPQGRYRSQLPLPDQRAVDLAVSSAGAVYIATLGDAAVVSRVGAGGVSAAVAAPFGVVARLRVASGPPMALVGDAQYVPVRVGSDAVPVVPRARAAPPAPGGGSALTGPVGQHAFAATWGDGQGALVRLPHGVLVGSDYFTVPLADGGAIVAQGLYAPGRNVVAILHLDAAGHLVSFLRLPEPSLRQDARWSTVRWRPPGEVLAIYEDPQGVRIDRFEVI